MGTKYVLGQYLNLAAILAIGFAVVWAMIVAWSARVLPTSPQGNVIYEQLLFRRDGTAVVRRYSPDNWDARTYRDLSGKDIDIGSRDRSEAEWSLEAASLGFEERTTESSFTQTSRDPHIPSFYDGQKPPNYWYFMADGKPGGAAHLVGFNSFTKTRVGFLGTNGFHSEGLGRDEEFPFSGSYSYMNPRVINPQQLYRGFGYPRGNFIQTPGRFSPASIFVLSDDHKLYLVDLEARTTRLLLENPSMRSMGFHTYHADANDSGRQRLAVRTDDEVISIDADYKIVRRTPIPEELRHRAFGWAETSAGEVLIYYVNRETLLDGAESSTDQPHYRIFWLDNRGQIKRRASPDLEGNSNREMAVMIGAVLPGPLPVWAGLGFLQLASGVPAAPLGFLWPSILIAHLAGVLFGLLCYRRQVRFAAKPRERIVWPLFVFVFGLPGWIGYRYSRAWPVLEKCPHCGAAAPRDRVICSTCVTEFPPPALKGTEIFA